MVTTLQRGSSMHFFAILGKVGAEVTKYLIAAQRPFGLRVYILWAVYGGGGSRAAILMVVLGKTCSGSNVSVRVFRVAFVCFRAG